METKRGRKEGRLFYGKRKTEGEKGIGTIGGRWGGWGSRKELRGVSLVYGNYFDVKTGNRFGVGIG